MEAPIIQKPELQSRVFYLIKLINDAIHAPDFQKLIVRTAGDTLKGKYAGQIYRFYMRGSSASVFYTENTAQFPIPFTSDIDMMVLVNPTLPAALFTAIRGLLFQRVLDTIIEFTETDAVKYMDDFFVPKDRFDESEYKAGVAEPAYSKRVISKSMPRPDNDPIDQLFNSSDPIKVGSGSMLQLSIQNEIAFIDTATGNSKSLGLSLISVMPRIIDTTAVLDIAFPKLNFLDSPDYSRIYYEWLESDGVVVMPINIPATPKKTFEFAPLFKTKIIGTFPAFSFTIPIINLKYAEIDTETSIATTSGEAKRSKRIALAGKLRNAIVKRETGM